MGGSTLSSVHPLSLSSCSLLTIKDICQHTQTHTYTTIRFSHFSFLIKWELTFSLSTSAHTSLTIIVVAALLLLPPRYRRQMSIHTHYIAIRFSHFSFLIKMRTDLQLFAHLRLLTHLYQTRCRRRPPPGRPSLQKKKSQHKHTHFTHTHTVINIRLNQSLWYNKNLQIYLCLFGSMSAHTSNSLLQSQWLSAEALTWPPLLVLSI